MKQTNINFRLQSVFCAGLTATLIAGCGQKKSDDEPAPAQQTTTQATVPVVVPPATTPVPSVAPSVTPVVSEKPAADGLAVDIANRSAIDAQNLQAGSTSIQFGLRNTQTQIPGIIYKCKLETAQTRDTAIYEVCSSPKAIQVQQPGQYFFTVMAVHEASGTIGMPTQISFTVGGSGNGQNNGQNPNCIPTNNGQQGSFGNGQFDGFGQQMNNGQGSFGNRGGRPGNRQGQFGQNGNRPGNMGPINNNGQDPNCIPGNGGVIGGGQSGIPGGIGLPMGTAQQVGDMFTVNVPQGFHMVYRSSTFDTPGYLNFQYIEGGRARDTAAPYAYSCQASGTQFQTIEQLMMPSGQTMEYCNMTPPLAFNSPADPIFNSFRWMNMNTMSYNSIALASDNSLANANAPIAAQPTMAKLYVNVFTNVSGIPSTPHQAAFANELSQTVSRLEIACAGQTPQYMGDAAIFQGYFAWQVAATPLFGCVTPRNNQWYVEVAAFPIDQNMSILPAQGWGSWIGQSFANKRAAEIVVEIGPFPYAPAPISVAPDAQAIMVQNIKKLLPSALPGPGYNNPTGPWIPAANH